MSEKKPLNTEENKAETKVKAADSLNEAKNNEKASSATNKKTVLPSSHVEANQKINQAPVVIKQTSKGWAFMAILLSLIALGATGFLYVEGKNQLNLANLTLEQKSNLVAVGDSENGRLLQQSLYEQQKIINKFSAIDENIKLLNQRYDNAGKAYNSLTTGRLQWLIDETEYTLNIASQQLMFSGDIQSTLKTLATVEKRLNHFNQAQLLPLKKAISVDYQLIKEQSYVDVVSASLRIDRLNSAIDTLPLLADSMLVPEELKIVVEPQKQNLTWYENLWANIKSNSVNLVQVRKIDNADTILISPEQAYFLRQNIKLRFLATRIALLQHQQDIYSNELNQIKQTVSQYFNKNDQRTTVLLNELDELLQLKLALPASNNLKNSLDAIAKLRGEFGNIEETVEIGQLTVETSLNDITDKTPSVDAKENTQQPAIEEPLNNTTKKIPPAATKENTQQPTIEEPLNNTTEKTLPTKTEEESKAIEKSDTESQSPKIVEERITLGSQPKKGDNQ